jgi:2-polyprenyl-3-methyl-5-hydroxy-6-metoxy-1,4-benzoquinol methylase
MIDFSKEMCMLCGNTGLQFINKLRDDDHRFVAVCPECGHVQVSPLPTIKEDDEFYQKNEMTRRLIPKTQMDDHQMMMKYEIWAEEQCKLTERVFSIAPPPPTKRILEIGSGYGWFVEKMRSRGYAVDGIELSVEKRRMAYNRAGIELLSYNLLEPVFPDTLRQIYDTVCMFHVLEHIIDPNFFLKQILRALKSGGKLLIVVPNYFNKLKTLSKQYNNFDYLRAHLSYFKPETLRFLLEHIGLTSIEIKGTQLYSLENAIHWIRNGTPFLAYSQIEMPKGLEWIGEYYKRTLEDKLISDGLIAIGTKPFSSNETS